MKRAERLVGYGAVSTSLALLSDGRLRDLIDTGHSLGSGIGGTSFLVDVEGTPVFAKRIRLTDLERRPENVMSTANIFGLPTFYQYGVGSAGFGAWRELAVHTMTTNWVLTNQRQSFPLTYHWRVLTDPHPEPLTPQARAELDSTVAYWEGSAAVRERLEAIEQSTASIVLFLEYVPHTVHEWLKGQVGLGEEAIDSACAMADRSLRDDVAFMRSRGLVHFDAHLNNILTDGRRLYFADFGLATCSRFELSGDEREFFWTHLDYDRAETEAMLANWLVRTLCDTDDLQAFVRECAAGKDLGGLPPAAAAIIKRSAPVAVVMNELFRALTTVSKSAPYPAAELERIWATTKRPDHRNRGVDSGSRIPSSTNVDTASAAIPPSHRNR